MRQIFSKYKTITVVIMILLSLLSLLLFLIPDNNNKPVEEVEGQSRVSLGKSHSSLLTEDGRLFMWGNNEDGQLGNGKGGSNNDLENTPIEITDQFIDEEDEQIDLTNAQISMGGSHSSLLTEDGRLFMWGRNNAGQLGNGQYGNYKKYPTDITNFFIDENKETINLVDSIVSMGGDSSSLLTSDGRLFMWGANLYGQLGNGTTNGKNTPTEITYQFTDDEELINLTNAHIWIGGNHSSLLTKDGRLFMWGDNIFGQLGDDTYFQKNTPTEITNEFVNEEDEQIDLSQGKIALGLFHSSLLTKDGKLFMWGLNADFQLGDDGDSGSQVATPIEVNKYFEEDGINLSNSRISLGLEYSALLTEDGRLFMWGNNESGQLGDGTIIDKKTPSEITYQFFDDEQVDLTDAQISIGGEHSSLLTEDGRLFIWGRNNAGQLGNGSLKKELSPIEIFFV